MRPSPSQPTGPIDAGSARPVPPPAPAAVPAIHRARYGRQRAAADMATARRALECASPVVMLDAHDAESGRLSVRIFNAGAHRPLSATLPTLENLGLVVSDAFTCRLLPAGAADGVELQDFACLVSSRVRDPHTHAGDFVDVLARTLDGGAEDDRFNALVLAAGGSLREVAVMRAYARYLVQLRAPWNVTAMATMLIDRPHLARALIDLFLLRFDSSGEADRAQVMTTCADELEAAINALDRLDEERFFRRFLDAIQATVRTNFFQRDADGLPPPSVALKFDCARIAQMPAPRPWREIFVSAANVEGVHLRGGPIARGGLRHSDRASDYRSEILDLFKAQQVKNAVIVPAGAKGGFTVRAACPDRAAIVAAYRTFVGGLLDVTDTIENGQPVPLVAHTVRLDGDDPYLVVAADKGTATFSDLANAIARERGYWLGDAFASGGSAGYDHKRMGITARGAWESVRRHFRELGTNVDAQAISAVGVGDMSGDVFGNGMLISPHLRLVAAFDHRHILIDPDPDPAAAYAERQRLFTLPTSSWNDYDAALISAGGGVYARDAKRIALSAQARAALGCDAAWLTPDDLIRAILMAPVDLLWFGGIGTYVKAAAEPHEAIADHANLALRIDACDLRCRVIGEGANLALTQRGRVEFAIGGGRLNTDAIDNAAGVNCSDHEVNIKILLDLAVRQGRFDAAARDKLLADMTDDVARLVLRDNYLQTQAITVAASQALAHVDRHLRLMAMLERNGQLDRRLAGLPDDDTLNERCQRGYGLTRPEIAELLAHTKMSVTRALLDSDMPDDVLLNRDLRRYFPAALHAPCRGLIEGHPLRREIIVTRVVNSMINRVGSGFVCDMMERTGCGDAAVARAYAVARDIFGLTALWHAIEALDNIVPAALQTELLREVGGLVEEVTEWLLEQAGPTLSISATVAIYAGPVKAIAESLPAVLAPAQREIFDARAVSLEQDGVPRALARRIASLVHLHSALDIARLAQRIDFGLEAIASIHFAIGERSGLAAVRTKLAAGAGSDAWEREAARVLRSELLRQQARLTRDIAQRHGDQPVTEAIARFEQDHARVLARCLPLADAICRAAAPSFARITILNHAWRRALEATA